MTLFEQKGPRGFPRLALLSCLLVLAALLTACGNEAASNNDFSTPVPNGLEERPAIANDQALRSQLLQPAKTDVVGQSLRVYVTKRDIPGLRQSYRDEMIKRGWTDASASIVGNAELGSRGSVEAFEKLVGGDNTKKQVFGIIILSPDATKNPLDPYRAKGDIASDQNVVITIRGAIGIPANQVTP